MTEYILSKSKNKNKKWALSNGDKTINFGANGYEDYTIHKDLERQKKYINRHKSKEEPLWDHTK